MLIHLLLGFLGSYIGGIPFGPLNLSVVEITLKKDRQAAARFAITASLVEIAEASIAILFGKMIIVHLEANTWIKLAVVLFFISFGLFFIFKKETPCVKEDTSKGKSAFIKGLVVSVLNPQAIPYWIFFLTFVGSYITLELNSWHLIFFLAGVSIGKYFILSTFGVFSTRIQKRMKNLCSMVSKIIGFVLITIGIFQVFRFFG